jgi:hypothetical protein
MSAEPSKLARWLPTLLGVGAALTVAALYELGVFGSTPAPDEPCCTETREPPPERAPALPDRPHPHDRDEREQLVEAVEQAQTREQLLADQAATGEVRFTNLSQAELEAMANNCDVRTDYPVRLAPEDLEDLDLAPDEQVAYERALVRFAEEENTLYRDLYSEVASPDVDVDALSNTELRTKLVQSLGRGKQAGDQNIRKTIAEERAGMKAAPDDPDEGSVYARYTRARFAAGDRFAALLEEELGEARTQELRTAFDGWKGVRMREFECPPSE